MSSFRNIDVKSPDVQGLQQAIQIELANRNYSSDDDSIMAEYIVVMLANQKTAEQVTSEMKDLIGAEYDAAFTEWVWNTAQSFLDLDAAPTSVAASTSTTVHANESDFPAHSRNYRQGRSRSPQASGSTSRAREQRRSRSPASANTRRGNEGRLSRSRSPPARGTARARLDGDHRTTEADSFDGKAYWRKRAEERRRNPPPPVKRSGASQIFNAAYSRTVRNESADTKANAQKELFPTSAQNDDEPPLYAESEGLGIFGRARIPDPRAPAFVPSSATAGAEQTQPEATESGAAASSSASIFSRIDPMLPNNPPPASVSETSTPTGRSSDFPTAPTETSICRWNVCCTNPMCPYSHASPANAGPNGDPNALVLSQQGCRFGARCNNKDCTRSHVSPAIARIQSRTTPSVPQSFPFRVSAAPTLAPATTLSMDTALPTSNSSRPCRFGAACTRADCFFSHPPSRSLSSTATASNVSGMQTACRFGLGCTRADCYFSHPPGQRASTLGARGTAQRLHVFSQSAADDDEMELIIPGRRVDTERDGSETIRSSSSVVPISLST